ncbi:hypothetical protein EIL50_04665 [bacterium NHP-B]|nr:hypothetical protein EIL50_04665 [bacterium NHP-B]
MVEKTKKDGMECAPKVTLVKQDKKTHLGSEYFYELGTCSMPIPDAILKSFEALPTDPYIKGLVKYRKRRYRTALYEKGRFHWEEGERFEFKQSKILNTYVGDIDRVYDGIFPHVCDFLAQWLEISVLPHLESKNYLIGAHQLRVIATGGRTGLPAPEGFHQDGFDYVCIISIQRVNVRGGKTILKKKKNDRHTLFEGYLKPREFLLLDDRSLFHYKGDVQQIDQTADGLRDVFVVTFQHPKII